MCPNLMFLDIVNKAFLNTEFECISNNDERPPMDAHFVSYSSHSPYEIPSRMISTLTYTAFRNIAFYFRESHLQLLHTALNPDSGASDNERFVIQTLLENACIASKGELCICQDSGVAHVYVWPESGIICGDPVAAINDGVKTAYSKHHLRSSILEPDNFFCEKNTCNNLPAQLVIFGGSGSSNFSIPTMRFLFTAKGGGSANKTAFWAMAPSILDETKFYNFLCEKINDLGTSACPPYRLVVVVGGLSPEQNLETLKLASTELLDAAPYFDGNNNEAGDDNDHRENHKNDDDNDDNDHRENHKNTVIFRDRFWENKAMEIACKSGIGAQAGGKFLCLDARILRLPRHAASCFVSIGVSCSAHRNALGYINADGMFLEKLASQPAAMGAMRLKHALHLSAGVKPAMLQKEPKGVSQRIVRGVPKDPLGAVGRGAVPHSLCLPVTLENKVPALHFSPENYDDTRKQILSLRKGQLILISGKIITARDAAHGRWHKIIRGGGELPEYLRAYPVFYAGPAATPSGMVCGSIGPTTAGRMDTYSGELFRRGLSLVSIAKGTRSSLFYDAAAKYGAVYLCAIGGAAAFTAERNIVSAKIIDYADLGMEAVRLLEVKDLAVFVG
ncbi:hypothetical protein FACS1894102_3140 [Spirochaetia bacterium]|nr:hypothetical protein FACS1894102_3140 [Spirochaetia bacterium]